MATKLATKAKPEPSGDLLLQIEYFRDANAMMPEAFGRFMKRLAFFGNEADQWGTVVVDSTTSMELASRMNQQYVVNPRSRDPRQWYGGSSDDLERALQVNLSSLYMNVIVITHTDREKEEMGGVQVQAPNLRGRLKMGAASTFSEIYYSYTTKDAEGNRVRGIQTQTDNLHFATTQIDVPDPCVPDYDSLWDNAEEDKGVFPLHIINYGDPGAGKSTFAASFVKCGKPVLVWFFDGFGKERPYLKVGSRTESDVNADGTPIVRVYR